MCWVQWVVRIECLCTQGVLKLGIRDGISWDIRVLVQDHMSALAKAAVWTILCKCDACIYQFMEPTKSSR